MTLEKRGKMKRLFRPFAGIMVVSMMLTAVSCANGTSSSEDIASYPEETSDEIFEETTEPVDINGQTIVWAADYDIRPSVNERAATALSVFRDFYGADIEYIRIAPQNKLEQLSELLNGGTQVDVFPYEAELFPEGTVNGLFEPLDDYFDIMGVNEGLWDNLISVSDELAYDGNHYVMPYSLSDISILTYSKKIMEKDKLGDPYQLYLDGKWDWDAMTKMIDKFVSKAEEGQIRYGIKGNFGKAVLQSTGYPIVSCENGVFKNNIEAAEIKKAEQFMQKLYKEKSMYNSARTDYFPSDGSTLFFASSEETIAKSNAENKKDDIMIVPFPKAPGADKNYITCNFDARMLVKGSQNAEAVALYLRCERLAASYADYLENAKNYAVGIGIKEEQLTALMKIHDTSSNTPVVDFGWGMGSTMNGIGDCTYDTRGAMINLTSSLLDGTAPDNSWKALRDRSKEIIDEALKNYN